MTRVAKWLYIDDNGYGLINGDKQYRFKLPSGQNGWNIGELEYAFKQACIEYDFIIPEDDETLSRILLQATTSLGKRVVSGAGDSVSQTNAATEEGPKEITPSERLYKLALIEIAEMFRDEELQTPYAILTIEGKRYVLNMESEQFRFKLRVLYENHVIGTQDMDLSPILSEQDLNKVIQQLLAKNDKFRKLYLRSFFDGHAVYYDFCNQEYQYAIITPEGYTIKDDAYHIFKRYDDYHAQVLPDSSSPNGGELLDGAIKSFNIIDNEYGDKNLLFKIGLMALLFRAQTRITTPIWTVNGPHGASKSSLLLFLKFLVDPINGNPKSMVNRWGREEQTRDRGLVVSKNYFVIFDNMSRLSDAESDELCIYSTGGRWEERKLHTNVDTVRYELQGNIGCTSINDIAKQPDLISRQLNFELDIRTKNIAESVFWNLRAKEKPAILHYIFGVLGRAIPIYNKLSGDPGNLTSHRLADFMLMCEAISQAIGQPGGRVFELFKRIEQEQAERSIDNSSFASFFADYVLNSLSQKGKEIDIQPAELFEGAKQHADAIKYDTFGDVDFPKNVIQLGKKIQRIRPALLKFNIDIRPGPRTNRGNTYRIRIVESMTTKKHEMMVKGEQAAPVLTEMGGKQEIGQAPQVQLFACVYCDHNANSYELLESHALNVHVGRAFAADYQKRQDALDNSTGF